MNEEGMNLLKDMDLLPTPGEIPEEELDEPEVTTRDFTAEDEAIASLMKRAPEPLKALVKYYHSISVIDQNPCLL